MFLKKKRNKIKWKGGDEIRAEKISPWPHLAAKHCKGRKSKLRDKKPHVLKTECILILNAYYYTIETYGFYNYIPNFCLYLMQLQGSLNFSTWSSFICVSAAWRDYLLLSQSWSSELPCLDVCFPLLACRTLFYQDIQGKGYTFLAPVGTYGVVSCGWL